MNRLFLATAAAIYVAVFVAFLLFEHPGLGIAHFFYLAIALVALVTRAWVGCRCGRRWRRVLYMTGVLINHAMPSSEILTISTPIRGVNYFAIGALLGWFAAHYRAGERGASGSRPARPRHRAARTPGPSSARSTAGSRRAHRSRCSSGTSTRVNLSKDRDEALRLRRRHARGRARARHGPGPRRSRRSWPC